MTRFTLRSDESKTTNERRSGFIRKAGVSGMNDGPLLSAGLSDRKETAEILSDLAIATEDSGIIGNEPFDMIVWILRSNPAFHNSETSDRTKMVLDLLDIFETLDSEEIKTATDLYQCLIEVISLGEKFSTETKLQIVPQEFQQSVSSILFPDDSAKAGDAQTFGAQLPLIIVEHARNIARNMRYDREQRALETGLWALDDDISNKGRAALKASFGMYCTFAEASDILTSLSTNRIEELGLAGAIVEMCKLWQYMREHKMDDSLALDGISALGTVYDSEIPPKNMRVVMILAEISSDGKFVDPYVSLIGAIKKLPK